MSKLTDGGPAFPSSVTNGPDGTRTSLQFGLGGMTLRDWFAGQALAGCDMTTWDGLSDCTLWKAAELAARAYQIADAMLAERKRGGAA